MNEQKNLELYKCIQELYGPDFSVVILDNIIEWCKSTRKMLGFESEPRLTETPVGGCVVSLMHLGNNIYFITATDKTPDAAKYNAEILDTRVLGISRQKLNIGPKIKKVLKEQVDPKRESAFYSQKKLTSISEALSFLGLPDL